MADSTTRPHLGPRPTCPPIYETAAPAEPPDVQPLRLLANNLVALQAQALALGKPTLAAKIGAVVEYV